jgi:hypothetical protein
MRGCAGDTTLRAAHLNSRRSVLRAPTIHRAGEARSTAVTPQNGPALIQSLRWHRI